MLIELQDVKDKSFDYVIAGGGPAALTLAARLTDDPNRSVLILESGGISIDDPMILLPGLYGYHFGKDQYTWPHKSIPQKYAGETKLEMFRGKGLGGSSCINFFSWTKPSAEDINDFERLGNPGWNWEALNHSLRKIEGYAPPPNEIFTNSNARLGLWDLGQDGPLKLAFPPQLNTLDVTVQETMHNVGIPPAPNPLGGDIKGYYYAPVCHDPVTRTRSYAASAFWLPNQDRPNFNVLLHAHVSRVVLDKVTAKEAGSRAQGVEFLYNGKRYVVNAAQEVILCAGALKSPQILELSGIGNPEILNEIDVPVLVDLPGVGENVQEHFLTGALRFELKDDSNFVTCDPLLDPAVAEEERRLHKLGQGWHVQAVTNFTNASLEMISSKADEIYASAKEDIEKKLTTCSPGRRAQYELQLNRRKYGRPGIEILTFPGNAARLPPMVPGKKYVSLSTGIVHPFSVGKIHCVSNDPMQDAVCDLGCFEEDVDLKVAVEGFHFLRRVAATAPLKDIIACEVRPGPDVEPDNDEQAREFIKKSVRTIFHTSSSCSMLPRDKGGVVDPQLKVYGTANLRVVDLSIIPIQVAAHTQSIAYAIGAHAAEIIIQSESQ